MIVYAGNNKNRVIARHVSAVAISITNATVITAPINIEQLRLSMLSTVSSYHPALQEIPTGLRPSE